MKKNEILDKIIVKYPDKWIFIVKMLDKLVIENIASNYAEVSEDSEQKEMFEDLGLELMPRDIPEDCMHFLLRQASVMMWRNISKDQVNSILKAMDSVNAISIRLADGNDYTARKIMEHWKKVNEEA